MRGFKLQEMKDKQIIKELASNQDRIAKAIGLAAVGAFLAIFLGLVSYAMWNDPLISYLIISLTGILTFALIGASLHMSLVESTVQREEVDRLKSQISKRMESIEKLIQLGNRAMRTVNASSKLLSEVSDLNSMRSHSMLVRVLAALNARLEKYMQLMDEGDLESLETAFDLIDAPLEFDNSRVATLDGEQIPLLEKEHWEVTIHSLISELGVALDDDEQRAA